MNRNNGLEIGKRLVFLRDYLFANADKTHAVKTSDIQTAYSNKGFEGQNGVSVNIKTIYRDLDALKDNFHIETKYVDKHKASSAEPLNNC